MTNKMTGQEEISSTTRGKEMLSMCKNHFRLNFFSITGIKTSSRISPGI